MLTYRQRLTDSAMCLGDAHRNHMRIQNDSKIDAVTKQTAAAQIIESTQVFQQHLREYVLTADPDSEIPLTSSPLLFRMGS